MIELRKLIRRVHPDLFHSHEACREVNEKSFQTLMQFLDCLERPFWQSRHGDFHLIFFYRNSEGTIQEASLTLQVPPGMLTTKERQEYGVRSIRKICRAVGIEDIEEADVNDIKDSSADANVARDLSQFLAAHLAASRLRWAAYERNQRQFEKTRRQLEDSLNIRVSISIMIDENDAMIGLQRMSIDIEEFRRLDLTGLCLRIDREYACRENGTLCIPYDFAIDEAVKFLTDQRGDAKKKSKASDVCFLEKNTLRDRLRNRLKLRWIGSSSECGEQDVLRGMICLQQCSEKRLPFDLHDLTIWIGKNFRATADGTLVVPPQFRCAELKRFLLANVEAARSRLKKADRLRNEIEERRRQFEEESDAFVRESVWVSQEVYSDALGRMIQAIGVFREMDVKGLRFSIGDDFRVLDDGTIQIKHDFAVKDLTVFLLPQRNNLGQDDP
jgi:hypothetical protein